jgi:hypothetical protein
VPATSDDPRPFSREEVLQLHVNSDAFRDEYPELGGDGPGRLQRRLQRRLYEALGPTFEAV